MEITKLCEHCKSVKPISDFTKNKALKSGLQKNCRICTSTYVRNYKFKNKEKVRKWNRNGKLKSAYNITLKDYENMYKSQKGNCKICRKHFDKLVVDHIHGTKRIRGLLCTNCNLLIGHAKESPGILLNARMYLN